MRNPKKRRLSALTKKSSKVNIQFQRIPRNQFKMMLSKNLQLMKSEPKVKMVREAAVDVEEVETEEPIEVSIEAVVTVSSEATGENTEETEETEESIEEEEVTVDVVVTGKKMVRMMKAFKWSQKMVTKTEDVAEAEEEVIEVKEEPGEVVKVVKEVHGEEVKVVIDHRPAEAVAEVEVKDHQEEAVPMEKMVLKLLLQ